MPLNLEQLPPIPSLFPEADPPLNYALETLRFEGKTQDAPLLGLSAHLALAQARGWKRRLLATEVTGNPKQMLQLFETPAPYPGDIDQSANVPAEQQLNVMRTYQRMTEDISELERVILAPLPYDPGAQRPKLDKNDTLLLVRARIRDGAMQRFIVLKRDFFIPTVAAAGWEMFFAGYVVSSSQPQSTVIQCWRLPDANTLPRTMATMAQNGTYREYVAPCINEERQLLYSAVSGDS